MAWKAGQSGNPAGRPKGTRDWRLSISQSKQAKLKRKLISMALNGDMRAMQLVADRLWPRIRPQALPVQVDAAGSDLASQGSAIIAAALAGNLTPDVLRDLLSALADQARLVEFTAIEERLQKLESQTDAPPWAAKPERELLPLRSRKHRRTENAI